MRRKIIGLIGAGCFFFLSAAWAQDAPKKERFDLYGCVLQALKSNPEVAVARLDVEEAELQLRSAKLARTPKLELFNRTGIVEDARGDAITGEDIEGSFGAFNRLNVLFSLPLYTFGRISQNIQAADENVDRQKATEFKTTSELILTVHRRYYGYVLVRQLLKTTEEIQNNFSEAAQVAEERLERGDTQVTETDSLKLKVGLAVVTKNLYKIQRQAEIAKESLREVMGVGEGFDFEVADVRLTPVTFELLPLNSYLLEARQQNPVIRQLTASVSAEEARYLAERSKYYPTFLAVGGLRHGVAPGRENQDNPFLNDEYNFFDAGVSLGVRWDLNFWQTGNDVAGRKVGYLRMKSRLDRVLNATALLVKDKYHQYIEKEKSLDASFEAKKTGRALLFLNLTNFKLGIGSGKDLFDALSLHARVDGEYYEAIFEHNMAAAELLEVIGGLHPETFKSS